MIEVTQEEQEDKARKDLRSTVNEIIEDVCDHYCKYPEQWDAEKEGMELIDSDICINCPLSRL